MKGLPQLTYCCCGCSIRTGSYVIGYMELIGYIVRLILLIVLVVQYANGTLTIKVWGQELQNKNTIIALGVLLLYTTACFINTIVLLFGLEMKKPNYIEAYIIVDIIFNIVSFILYLVLAFVVTYALLFWLIPLVPAIYFLLVINSYLCVIQNEESIVTTA